MVPQMYELLVSQTVKFHRLRDKSPRSELTLGAGPFTCIATASIERRCAPRLLNLFRPKLTMEAYSKRELMRIAMLLAWQKGRMRLETATAEALVDFPEANPHKIQSVIDHLSLGGQGKVRQEDLAESLYALGFWDRRGDPTSRRDKTAEPSNESADLSKLSGRQFEQQVFSLLQMMGFRATLTKATGDGGIDIEAELSQPITGGRFLFQCKRLTADVGAPQVRDFYGAVSADPGAVKGVFITTAGFTPQARSFGAKVGLELVDGAGLLELLKKHRG